MNNRLLNIAALTLFALTLGACNVLPERPTVDLYQLPPSAIATAPAGATEVPSLRLDRPRTSDALGGTRIMVMTSDNSFQAYPAARWSAPVPTLWRDWLLDAFWRDGRVSQLSASADGLQAQLELTGMLRGLHTEHLDGRSEAVVRYDVQLIDTRTRSIVASERFESRQALAGTSTADAVRALGSAADQLAADLIRWTVQAATSLPDNTD